MLKRKYDRRRSQRLKDGVTRPLVNEVSSCSSLRMHQVTLSTVGTRQAGEDARRAQALKLPAVLADDSAHKSYPYRCGRSSYRYSRSCSRALHVEFYNRSEHAAQHSIAYKRKHAVQVLQYEYTYMYMYMYMMRITGRRLLLVPGTLPVRRRRGPGRAPCAQDSNKTEQ